MTPTNKSCTDRTYHFAQGINYSGQAVLATAGAVAFFAITLFLVLSGPALLGLTIYRATLNPMTLIALIPASALVIFINIGVATWCNEDKGSLAMYLPDLAAERGATASGHFKEAFA